MANRRILVIGSQCSSFNHLSFLPALAQELHTLMMRPNPGECIGAGNGNGPGLFLDPTVEDAKKAIRAAIKESTETGESLILVYIGHGHFPDERMGHFYLMPTDATEAT